MNLDPPLGDAEALRARAARMGLECQHLEGAAAGVVQLAAEMDYRCKAGQAFRDEVNRQRADLAGIVRALQLVRQHILQEAGRVEAAQQVCLRLARLGLDGAVALDDAVLGLYHEAERLRDEAMT
jgi:hypothetical protein